MAFQPDILVTTPDGISLVIEAKVELTDFQHTEEQLKDYMVQMQCPTGVLVTPKRMWVYRDSFTTRLPESVRRVGEFDLHSLWKQAPPTKAESFEAFVQQWFEDLSHQSSKAIPGEMRESLAEYILPAVAGGSIRAAHPRY